ncbi:MAG: ABC transporter permease subunit [Pirellulales bacterium]
MPIYEFGYRQWHGPIGGRLRRAWAITAVGVRLAWNSRLLRRMLYVAWTPLLYFGPLFFAVGSVTETSDSRNNVWYQMLQAPLGPQLTEQLSENPEAVRPAAWSVAFYYYLGISQSIVMVLVVASVGAPLIAQDVRSKSFLLYFSKPITRWDYLLGKAGVLLTYIFLVTLLPALALYLLSIGFAPSLAALPDTGWTVLRIVAASAVIATPATLLMLSFSAVGGEPRFASFAWIATWFLGGLFYAILDSAPGLHGARWPMLFSLHRMTTVLVEAIFDVRGQLAALQVDPVQLGLGQPQSSGLALAMLACVCAICLAVLWRRVTAPLNV